MTTTVDRVGTKSTYAEVPNILPSEARGTELPAPTTTGSADDLMTLRRILLDMGDCSITTGKTNIQVNDQIVKKAIEEAAAARKRVEEARSEDGGFFSGICDAVEALTVDLAKLENISDPFGAVEEAFDKAGDATINSRQFWADLEKGAMEVAKWGAVAGSTVLAVGSFGAAAPIAALAIVGAVMSCAAAADSSFHILEKCGVSKDAAMWTGLVLSVGGAAASGGAGVWQVFSEGSAKATAAARIAGYVADGSSGGSAVVAGTAHMEVAAFEEDAKLAEADTAGAEASQHRVETRIQRTLDAIRETVESCERGKQRVASAINEQASGHMAVLMRA